MVADVIAMDLAHVRFLDERLPGLSHHDTAITLADLIAALWWSAEPFHNPIVQRVNRLVTQRSQLDCRFFAQLAKWHEAAGNPPLPRAHKVGRNTIKLVVNLADENPTASRTGWRAFVEALIAERLRSYSGDSRAYFKFVVAEPEDVAEVAGLVRAHALPKPRIFLMPEGTDSGTLRQRESWLVPLCLEHGFRLSDRLHIHLFGDTRGT